MGGANGVPGTPLSIQNLAWLPRVLYLSFCLIS